MIQAWLQFKLAVLLELFWLKPVTQDKDGCYLLFEFHELVVEAQKSFNGAFLIRSWQISNLFKFLYHVFSSCLYYLQHVQEVEL